MVFAKHIKAKLFLKINNKTFYDRLIKRKWYGYDQVPMNKDPIYYQTSEPLIFKSGKYMLVETKEKFPAILIEYGVLSLSVICGYKLISNIFKFKIIGSVVWTGLFFFAFKTFREMMNNRYFFIKNVYLLEDLKTLEVETMFDTFRINIQNVRRITEDEMQYYVGLVGDSKFVPLVLFNQTFAMSRNAIILNNDIFNAVTNGKYIKASEDKKVNDNYIDI
jgi:hypothetical protein